MRQANIDLMIEYTVARLATEDHQRINKTVQRLAQKWPNEPALAVAFALTSAAATLEEMVETAEGNVAARRAYKLAALVSADIFAIQETGQVPAKAQDLLHFWRRVDPYFLNL